MRRGLFGFISTAFLIFQVLMRAKKSGSSWIQSLRLKSNVTAQCYKVSRWVPRWVIKFDPQKCSAFLNPLKNGCYISDCSNFLNHMPRIYKTLIRARKLAFESLGLTEDIKRFHLDFLNLNFVASWFFVCWRSSNDSDESPKKNSPEDEEAEERSPSPSREAKVFFRICL